MSDEQDAARYRMLRDNFGRAIFRIDASHPGPVARLKEIMFADTMRSMDPASIDAAVDAAIAWEQSPKVDVLYICKDCESGEVPVPVRERGKDEDVVAWVELVRDRVHQHHRIASPLCRSSVVDLKIPLPNKDEPRIGEAQRQ